MTEKAEKSQKTAQWRFSVAPMMECENNPGKTINLRTLGQGHYSSIVRFVVPNIPALVDVGRALLGQ